MWTKCEEEKTWWHKIRPAVCFGDTAGYPHPSQPDRALNPNVWSPPRPSLFCTSTTTPTGQKKLQHYVSLSYSAPFCLCFLHFSLSLLSSIDYCFVIAYKAEGQAADISSLLIFWKLSRCFGCFMSRRVLGLKVDGGTKPLWPSPGSPLHPWPCRGHVGKIPCEI